MKFYVLEINELQSLGRRIRASSDGAEIESLLSEMLRYYNVLNFEFTYDRFLWRARKCTTQDGFRSIQEMLGPPKHLATAGRLNEPQMPMVYASINQFAALQEIGAVEGDFVQFVALKFEAQSRLRCAVVGEKMNVRRSGRAWLSDEIGSQLNRILNEMAPDAGRSYVFTDAFLATMLGDEGASGNGYLHSRTLARLLLAKQQNVEAIVYPSVALGNSMNFAIKPEVIGQALKVASTLVVRVARVFDYGIYDTRVVRRPKGQHGDGRVDWEAPSG